MTAGIDKRVEQLERRAGSAESITIIIVRLVAPGCEEPSDDDVIGYGSLSGSAPAWDRMPGESLEALRARVLKEPLPTGAMCRAVIERYAN